VTLLARSSALPPRPRSIRTPVLGFVELQPAELFLLDQPPFQRLRRIHQLAFSHYVYPGAEHSRFLHTLSVLEMGTRLLDRMEETSPENLGTPAAWRKRKQLFRLAALFHDTGHPPFSHAGESALTKGKSHEHFSVEILRNYEDVINTHFPEVTTNEIAQLLDPEDPTVDPDCHVVLNLLNGDIDADKLSYLLDDAYFCGVTYGRYDVRRFIETSRAYRTEVGTIQQAVEWGGLHVAEEVIVARYKMLIQVYFHRTRRAYDKILDEFLGRLLPDGLPDNLAEFLAWDDARVMREAELILESPAADEELRLWADRLINRHHVSAVFDPPTIQFDRTEAQRYITAIRALEERLEADGFIKDRDWWSDDAEKLPHKLTAETGEAIVVLDERGRPQSLHSKSPVVRALTERIHLYRIYAALGWEEQLETYRAVWQDEFDRVERDLEERFPES
jgi:uncharacterized protein